MSQGCDNHIQCISIKNSLIPYSFIVQPWPKLQHLTFLGNCRLNSFPTGLHPQNKSIFLQTLTCVSNSTDFLSRIAGPFTAISIEEVYRTLLCDFQPSNLHTNTLNAFRSLKVLNLTFSKHNSVNGLFFQVCWLCRLMYVAGVVDITQFPLTLQSLRCISTSSVQYTERPILLTLQSLPQQSHIKYIQVIMVIKSASWVFNQCWTDIDHQLASHKLQKFHLRLHCNFSKTESFLNNTKMVFQGLDKCWSLDIEVRWNISQSVIKFVSM